MSMGDWRSEAAYGYAAKMEPAGLAWEFLRRNPEYRTLYKDTPAHADDGVGGPARRWGLRFPGGPESAR